MLFRNSLYPLLFKDIRNVCSTAFRRAVILQEPPEGGTTNLPPEGGTTNFED